MMRNSDYILKRIGQREYRAINRLMGMLLIAIAVQFVINGIRLAFPLLSGGYKWKTGILHRLVWC